MKHCTTDKCPQILDSSCVFYEGATLLFSGINTNDSVEVVIQKLNLKLESIPRINLDNYYTKTEVNTLINNIDLSNYFTKTEVNTNLATKLDKGTYAGTAQSLKDEIDNKANSSDVYKKNEIYSQTEINSFLSGKQNNLGYTPENITNKSDSYTASSSTTYTSSKALVDGLSTKLDKGTYTGTASDLFLNYENLTQAIQNEATARTNADNLKLNKPTTTSTTASYPYVVGENGNGGSARLPAGDLGKNFFNSDLSNTTARNHTMNAGVTLNTLGNPHTLSGLPNKNTDIANFRKVRVQNTGGLDSVVDSKNLLTDGVTSMTDAEKDAWRLAQRKTNETYSLNQPRIDFANPPIIDKTKNYIQYVSLIGLNLFLPPGSIIKIYKKSDDTLYKTITNFQSFQNRESILIIGEDFSTWLEEEYYFTVKNGITNIESIANKNIIIKVSNNFENLPIPNLTYSCNNPNVIITGNSTNLVENQAFNLKSNEPAITQQEIIEGVAIEISFVYAGWAWARFASRLSLGLCQADKGVSDYVIDLGVVSKENSRLYSLPDSLSNGTSLTQNGNNINTAFKIFIAIKNGIATIFCSEVNFIATVNYNNTSDLFLKLCCLDSGNSSEGGRLSYNGITRKIKL